MGSVGVLTAVVVAALAIMSVVAKADRQAADQGARHADGLCKLASGLVQRC